MKNRLFLILFALMAGTAMAQPGANDPTFNPGDVGFGSGDGFQDGYVYSTLIQPDGKIIVGGGIGKYNSIYFNNILRLNPDGTPDLSFICGTGFNSFVRVMKLQSDGKIIVGGEFTSYNGISTNRIVRLNTNGSHDNTFNSGSGFNNIVRSLQIQSDGKIVVGGEFTSYNGVPVNRIVRLNADGSIDSSFNIGTGFNATVSCIVIQSDEKIVIGGSFSLFNGSSAFRIIRLNVNGIPDNTFITGTGFSLCVNSLCLQSGGKIVVGGVFESYNGTTRNRIARLNSNGSLDTSFDPGLGFNNIVCAIESHSSQKLIVGGFFTSFNGIQRNRIAILNSDGSLDISFDPGTGFKNNPVDAVYSISRQFDGRIIVGGWFHFYNEGVANRIVRLHVNGSIDNSFNPGSGFNNHVHSTVI